MGLWKSVKSGFKKAGKAVKNSAVNTYKTTKHLGGLTAKPLGNWVSNPIKNWAGTTFRDIIALPVKIFVVWPLKTYAIGFAYAGALTVGIFLAAFMQTSSVDIEKNAYVIACELKSANNESLECKCSHPTCTEAYPKECSGVVADPKACILPAMAAGDPALTKPGGGAVPEPVRTDGNSVNISGCLTPLSDAEIGVHTSVMSGERYLITFSDPDGYLLNYLKNGYNETWFVVGDSEIKGCAWNFGAFECLGPVSQGDLQISQVRWMEDRIELTGSALPSSSPKKIIPVEINGLWGSKESYCINPINSMELLEQDCDAIKNGIIPPNLLKSQVIRYRAVGRNCPIYASSLESSSVTLAKLTPISVNFWADNQSLSKGECTTIHWNVEGDVEEVWFAVDPGDHYTEDAGSSGSYQLCPDNSTKAYLQALDPYRNPTDEYSLEITVSEEIGPQQSLSSGTVTIGPTGGDSSGTVVDAPQNDGSTGFQGSNAGPETPPEPAPTPTVKFMNMDERGRNVCSLYFRIAGSSDWGQNYLTGELSFAKTKSVSLPHSGIYDVQYIFCVSQSGAEQAVSPYTLYNESLYDGAIVAISQ